MPIHRTAAGASFYCMPMVNAVPDSVLFNYAGFELGLAYSTEHKASDEWGALAERISKKDRPASAWLLVSAGASDNSGITYPAEEALADFLRLHPVGELRLRNLKRVTIHLWSGDAFDIWPEFAPVLGPLCQGACPSAAPAANPTTDLT